MFAPFLLAVLSATAPAAATGSTLDCRVLVLDETGLAVLDRVRDAGNVRWIELDREALLCATAGRFPAELDRAGTIRRHWAPVPEGAIRWLRGGRRDRPSVEGETVLAAGGRHAIAVVPPGARLLADGHGHRHVDVLPVPWNRSLARQARPASRADRPRRLGARGNAAVQAVDASRWFAAVESLSGFSRYVRGTAIDDAADWLVDRFSELPGLAVELDPFTFSSGGTVQADNVLALLDRGPGSDLVIVGGHYDSISENPFVAAPGAEDNASGCAGVLELARVLTALAPSDVSVLFVCYSGEELGLHGSRHQVDELLAAGEGGRLLFMLNMDMIGYTADADLDVLLETEEHSAWLLPLFEAAAEATSLRTVTSLFAFGSDHVPFLDEGLPAILTIQNDWNVYPDYHRTTDLPGELTIQMGAEILRMNAAVLAEATGAGQVPVFRDGFESGNTDAWTCVGVDELGCPDR